MAGTSRRPADSFCYPPMPAAVPDPAPAVRRVIALAATPRSGSTLLSRAVTATGQAGAALEMLNPNLLLRAREEFGIPRRRLSRLPFAVLRRLSDDPRWAYDRTLSAAEWQEYRDLVTGRYTTANGVFFVKYMWEQVEPALGSPMDVTTWGLPTTWLRQRRRDRALQAVSLMRARATGHFLHPDARRTAGAPPVPYDADLIAAAARDIAAWERSWDEHLARLGLDPPVVWYEDLDADYEGEMRRVFGLVGLGDMAVPPRQITRQGDASSQEWADRFRREQRGAALGAGP